MTQAIRLGINGASGRMGRALLELVRDDRRFVLVHAVVAPASECDGMPVFAGASTSLRYAHDWSEAPVIDAVVDFSGPAGHAAALAHCEARGIALVSGTTGLDAAQERRLDMASAHIAVLRAANFSLGVAVLARLLREASAVLRQWDLEIIEAHHGRKEDAPSGTALALGEVAAAARDTTLADAAVYVREGYPGTRRHGSIGFAVVRGGDIVGEHTALLAGQGERLELTHRATDRSIFARGALEAAAWLHGRAAGRYTIEDMLSDRLRTS